MSASPSHQASDATASPAEPTLRRGVGWSLFAFVASKSASFVALLILARLLVPSEFGLVAAVTTYLAFLLIISDLGVKSVLVYEQERGFGSRVQTAFTLNLMVVAAATAVGLLLAVPAAHFFGAEGHVELFFLCVLSLTFTGIGNIHDGLLLRELSLGKRVVPELVRGVVQGIVSVVLALCGLGASAVVIGVVCGSLLWTVAQWRSTPFRPAFTFDADIARSMVAYATGSWLIYVTSWLSVQADVIVVGNQLDSYDFGVYTMAYRLPELVIFSVAWTLSIVAFPALARERTRRGNDIVAPTARLIRYLGLYAFPVAMGMAILGQPLVDVAFSARWRASGPVLSAIAISVALLTVITPISDAGKAVGKQRAMALISLAHIPIVVMAVVVASQWGPQAVAWSALATTVVFLVALVGWAHVALRVTVKTTVVALRAPTAAAVGVAVVALPIRLLLTGTVPDVIVLIVGALGCLAGALGGVRLLAPGTLSEVIEVAGARALLDRLRPLRPQGATR